jgi:hypothetical protein
MINGNFKYIELLVCVSFMIVGNGLGSPKDFLLRRTEALRVIGPGSNIPSFGLQNERILGGLVADKPSPKVRIPFKINWKVDSYFNKEPFNEVLKDICENVTRILNMYISPLNDKENGYNMVINIKKSEKNTIGNYVNVIAYNKLELDKDTKQLIIKKEQNIFVNESYLILVSKSESPQINSLFS